MISNRPLPQRTATTECSNSSRQARRANRPGADVNGLVELCRSDNGGW
jgi:hypothetical protein